MIGAGGYPKNGEEDADWVNADWRPKIKEECDLPLKRKGCVHTIITE